MTARTRKNVSADVDNNEENFDIDAPVAEIALDNPEVTSESMDSSTEDDDTPVERIPEVLAENPIFAEFCNRYLAVFDEITAYNKVVLAEKDSEWNTTKVLVKARELGANEDADKVDSEVKVLLDAFEAAATALSNAKQDLIKLTADKLGINLSSVVQRDSTVEAPLKEKRTQAVEIGKQLTNIAGMTNNAPAGEAITEFFSKFGMPAIGRDSVRSFGEIGGSTPKYRLLIKATDADGNVKLEEKGITKAKLAAAKFYDRGQGITAEKLREAWEAAGNNSEKTVVDPVVFEDNNLTWELRKQQ